VTASVADRNGGVDLVAGQGRSPTPSFALSSSMISPPWWSAGLDKGRQPTFPTLVAGGDGGESAADRQDLFEPSKNPVHVIGGRNQPAQCHAGCEKLAVSEQGAR
jgi:hypothetical protein